MHLPFRLATGLAIASLLFATACDQRRTADADTCELTDFDPTGALTAGAMKTSVTLYGDVTTTPTKIPNGRWVTPLGTTAKLHTFSMRVAAHPGGRYYAVNNVGHGDFKSNFQSVSIVDGETGVPVTTVTHAKCPDAAPCDALPVEQLFGDVLFSADGTRLYAAGGGANVVHVIKTDPVTMPTVVATIAVPNYPTGLALLPGGEELLVTNFHKHGLTRVRLSDGKILKTYTVQVYPYGVTTDGKSAYVSNLGANSVSKVDLASGKTVNLLVGVNPEGVALTRDGKTLYVTNSDSDTISVIAAASFTTDATIDLHDFEAKRTATGMSPVDAQLSQDGKRLYVALAGDNAVAVLSVPGHALLGKIPTPWYPTTVAERAGGGQLAVVAAKGFGAGSNDPRKFGGDNPYVDEFVGRLQKGTITVFDTPTDAQLGELRTAVDRNNQVTRLMFKTDKTVCSRVKGPVPLEPGQPSPIKHVVYIVRENKTYDSNLGDYAGTANKANGDPSLAIWGKKVTPNGHLIAQRFANHDNYYSEPEQSVQGHVWAANGYSNDFSEKVWLAMWANRHDSLFLPAIEPASRGGNGGFILNLIKAGKKVRIYGEVTGLADQMTDELRNMYNWKYPAWSLHIRDRDKAKIFIDDLDKGIFPEFVYIWLPNDHTSGCAVGNAYPVSEIADNDEGTGMIIDAISKSRFWKDTAVFVFEDDPQSAPDHVDGHRSILLAASPYAKRGWTSKVQVSFPSIHRTTSLILGVPPSSRYEELATPLYDAFQETPDMEPFNYQPLPDNMYRKVEESDPPEVSIGGVNYKNCREIGAKFLKPNSLDMEDQIPGLGRILWYHVRGESPYPEALVADEDDD